MHTHRHLWDTYRFPGFRPTPTVQGIFGDPKARVIHLCRRGKKRHVARAGRLLGPGTTARHAAFATCPAGTRGSMAVEIRRVEYRKCGKVTQETLDWLADNPFYSKRFAFFVGRRCRSMTIKDVAEETRLIWKKAGIRMV